MRALTPRRLGLFACFGVLIGLSSLGKAEDREVGTPPVRIGMVSTLFRDMPESLTIAVMRPLGSLMESQTGVAGEIVPGGDALALGDRLASDKVQIGVFHGVEFGWARQRHPELRPLMIAINQQVHLRAHLVVRGDSTATALKDLQDKSLAFPRQSREHCHLYTDRQCHECKKGVQGYFSKVTNPSSVEEALDDVVDGVVQCAIADGVSLDCYKRRKPGRAAKLKLLQSSEVFPAAVVAYHPGTLSESTLARFRDGLLHAKDTILGRQMLTLWKLSSFEEVPPDYDQTLADIVRAYPSPGGAAK